ncbi:hypothetical protein AKJ09_08300 [Labilithrix luteola]|uniref:SnoaL-like domain-containing protein n=1 Tax=Labilithrix luteola TaxID=1391654 RepID=A0A0K1Q7J6_9BACT|nr:hypothetical protein [Labilithrix luteola]AKV01637.1 hypothetical protein AKJ09_08300 [Labilithrix luteola]
MPKIWKEKPSHDDVRRFLHGFFEQLRAGKVEEAKALVGHAYEDWNESLFTVWQDHYLIHEIPKDSSFEGREWDTNRAWLSDLTIKDDIEWVNDDCAWVDFIYRGDPSGYIGEFAVKQDADGYFVQRTIFKMA